MNLWAIFCLLVLSSYTANLAAVMVGEKTFEQVSGIHDDKVGTFTRTLAHFLHAIVTKGILTRSLQYTQGRDNEGGLSLFVKDYGSLYVPIARSEHAEFHMRAI